MKTKQFILLVFIILLLSTFASCKKKTECEKNGHEYVDATPAYTIPINKDNVLHVLSIYTGTPCVGLILSERQLPMNFA